MSTVPSCSLSAEGALRTFSWEVVCPSAGTKGAVAVAASGVADGRGVCVGGRVAVMMAICVGVGVSGAVTCAVQAVVINSAGTRISNEKICGVVRFTMCIVPKNFVLAVTLALTL